MAELEGKVAIVTGSGRGIGKAVAKVFAREGAKVVVASRTPATVEAVAQEIRDEGHTALGVPTDVSQKDQILAMVATTGEHYGTRDILINNAQGF
ncbi:MAG: SDR family NAD(P)-dependent oxidoreductase, partial [Gammaproteobacteria bacterium]|nr:SDR family NAD(P)-dependent oxidoreductase [Gammaproteobacteria bacterium]